MGAAPAPRPPPPQAQSRAMPVELDIHSCVTLARGTGPRVLDGQRGPASHSYHSFDHFLPFLPEPVPVRPRQVASPPAGACSDEIALLDHLRELGLCFGTVDLEGF